MRHLAALGAGLAGSVLLAGCGGTTAGPMAKLQSPALTAVSAYGPMVDEIIHHKVGKPYKIGGKWYTPAEDPDYEVVGRASWYGPGFNGRRTANGEIFDMGELTAAHPTLPLPSYARVTNLANNRSIVVRINDRGPYAHNRVIDVSARTAEVLGFKRAGAADVRVEFVGLAPPESDDGWLAATLEGGETAGAPTQVAEAAPPRPEAVQVATAPTPAARPAAGTGFGFAWSSGYAPEEGDARVAAAFALFN